MTETPPSRRVRDQQLAGKRVERAIESLMHKLASPASSTASILTPQSPSPHSYQSTFLPLSPPPSPPSPAPSLSLLGKLALSHYTTPSSPSSAPSLLSPPSLFSSLSRVPAQPLFTPVSPPPIPALFSRPSTSTTTHISRPATHYLHSHTLRSPPRLPSFSPPLSPPPVPFHHSTQPHLSSHHPHSHTYNSVAAADYERRKRSGDEEVVWSGAEQDEWRVESEADVRRLVDELRDELTRIARKLAAIKRYTARVAQQQQRWEEEEADVEPPLSPRTRHIMQLLEEADELLQHNRPTSQPSQHGGRDAQSRQAGWRHTEEEAGWTRDTARRRPKTAPGRQQLSGSTMSSGSASGSVSSVASNHLLRAYDELLDRFRSQVLRIDATLAAVD